MNAYLYRVQITAYPEGALRHDVWGSYPDPSWEPPGWDPDPEWVQRYGGDTGAGFFWPKTDRVYRSRSTATKLRKLLESYGATAIVQRSTPIIWPADGEVRA